MSGGVVTPPASWRWSTPVGRATGSATATPSAAQPVTHPAASSVSGAKRAKTGDKLGRVDDALQNLENAFAKMSNSNMLFGQWVGAEMGSVPEHRAMGLKIEIMTAIMKAKQD